MASKFSGLARKTAYVAFFIIGLVFMYGHGYKSGKEAQLSMANVIEIAKAQFTCKMELR